MPVPRVLLLIPTRTYRAEAFLEAARALGVEVTVGSEEPSSLAHLRPEDLLTLDFKAPAEAASAVVEFATRHPVAAVVAVDDGASQAAAQAAQALGLPHNPPSAVRAASDKPLMRRLLAAADVPQPAFLEASVDDDPRALAARAPFPCVLKPASLAASRGVIRADGPEAFQRAFVAVERVLAREEVRAETGGDGRILIEAFVPGPEVALEGLLEDGRLRVLALFDKPDPLDGPTFAESIYVTPSRRAPSDQAHLAELTTAACRALGLREGPVHAELRGTGERTRFIEVAARSIGGLCSRALRFGVGVSLEELLLRRALGLRIPSYDREARAAGVLMLHPERAGVLGEVGGLDEARALEGVEEVTVTAHRGQRVEPLPEGALYLGFAFARAETPEEVTAVLREVEARLDIMIG